MPMTVLLLAACAHQVSWQVQPVAAVNLPDFELAVLVDDVRCKEVAQRLVDALRARPGVTVTPTSDQKLVVTACEGQVWTWFEVETNDLGIRYKDVVTERRRYTRQGIGRAQMLVIAKSAATVTLDVSAERTVRGPWLESQDEDAGEPVNVQVAVDRDLGWQLADKIVPLPETISRRIYRDPEAGTAHELLNNAVDAEKAGDLDHALALARAAYAADPKAEAMDYIELLEGHASRVGYAFKTPKE